MFRNVPECSMFRVLSTPHKTPLRIYCLVEAPGFYLLIDLS